MKQVFGQEITFDLYLVKKPHSNKILVNKKHPDSMLWIVRESRPSNLAFLGINDHIDIRLEPGLFITKRELNYHSSYFNGLSYNDSDLLREVNSTYIHIPLLLKLSTKRVNNIKPFVVGGLSTAINLSSNENNPDDNSNGQFRSKSNVIFYEVGAGIDIYLPWFKFKNKMP